jgi:hypothetical protein
MGRYDILTNLENKPKDVAPAPSGEESKSKTGLPANQQTSSPVNQQPSKEVNQQTGKLVNQQTSKPTTQQTVKPVTQQTGTIALTTKEKKKYTTYLREDSILEIQISSAQTRKKDHEFLQEIVDFYFKNSKS